MKKAILLGLILLAPPGVAAAQQPKNAAPPPPAKSAPVVVTAEVDKTAIWVGDVLRYTLRAVYDPNVELVLDNFTKDRLPTTPFTVRDIDIRRGEWKGGKQQVEIVLMLSTLETGDNELTIPPVQVFYFTREPGLTKTESPVDTIAAPAVKIGLHSVLVPDSLTPRTVKSPPAPGLALALTPLLLGVAGLLALAGYIGWRIWQRMHSDDATRRLSREAREKIAQESLARVRTAVSASGTDDPRQWSAAMAAAVRRLVTDLFQIPGASLTPEEIEAALARSGTDSRLVSQIKTVLVQCDDLRYGKNSGAGPGLRAQLLQAVERVMQSPQLLSA
jgi:hypothetical protein